MSLFFSPKDPLEVLTLSVDFSALMESGETVQSAAWMLTRVDANEDTSTMLSGAVDQSAAPIIRQKVIGGTDNALYLHRVKITTSKGRTLVQGVNQAVKVGA